MNFAVLYGISEAKYKSNIANNSWASLYGLLMAMPEITKMVLIEGQGKFKLMGKSIVSTIGATDSHTTAQQHLFHVLNVKDVRAGMHLGYLGQRYKIVGMGMPSKMSIGVEIIAELVC